MKHANGKTPRGVLTAIAWAIWTRDKAFAAEVIAWAEGGPRPEKLRDRVGTTAWGLPERLSGREYIAVAKRVKQLSEGKRPQW